MCSLKENVKLPACLSNSLPLILKLSTFGVSHPPRSFLLNEGFYVLRRQCVPLMIYM